MDEVETQRRLFSPIENKVLEPGFLNFLTKNQIHTPETEQDSKSIQFDKYGFQEGSTAGSTFDSTVSSSSNNHSLQSPSSSRDMSHCFDENTLIELSSISLDAHINDLSTQQKNSSKRTHEQVRQEERKTKEKKLLLPPKSPARCPLPVHSRLAQSHTKSSMMRRNHGRSMKESRDKTRKKIPFYTTVSKSHSFSEFRSTSSLCDLSSLRDEGSYSSRSTKSVSPYFHIELSASETFSSNSRRQPKYKSKSNNQKPFYTTVRSSDSATFEDKRLTRGTQQRFDRNTIKESTPPLPPSKEEEGLKQRSPVIKRCMGYSRQALSSEQVDISKERKCNLNPSFKSHCDQLSIFDRLARTGTTSSLQRNRNSVLYTEDNKTFNECSKTALMRDFKGSTFVSIGKERVRKSIIGTVVNCG